MNQRRKILQVIIVMIMMLFHGFNVLDASPPSSFNVVSFTNVKLSQFTSLIMSITGKNYEFKPIQNKERRVTIFARFARNDATQFFRLVLYTCGLAILDDGKTIVPMTSGEETIQVSKYAEVEISNNSADEKKIDTNSLLSDLMSEHDNSMRDSVTVKPDKITIKDGDIHDFIWLTSEITEKNIVANQEVIGHISLDIPYPVTQKKFYQLFLETLQKHGYKAVGAGMYLIIEKK